MRFAQSYLSELFLERPRLRLALSGQQRRLVLRGVFVAERCVAGSTGPRRRIRVVGRSSGRYRHDHVVVGRRSAVRVTVDQMLDHGRSVTSHQSVRPARQATGQLVESLALFPLKPKRTYINHTARTFAYAGRWSYLGTGIHGSLCAFCFATRALKNFFFCFAIRNLREIRNFFVSLQCA